MDTEAKTEAAGETKEISLLSIMAIGMVRQEGRDKYLELREKSSRFRELIPETAESQEAFVQGFCCAALGTINRLAAAGAIDMKAIDELCDRQGLPRCSRPAEPTEAAAPAEEQRETVPPSPVDRELAERMGEQPLPAYPDVPET